MTSSRIPFIRPNLPELDALAPAFERIWQTRRWSNSGAFDQELAERLALNLDAAACVPVANGTLGLMLAARILTAGSNRKQAIVPSFTFPASALALEWSGLDPVFCDIDEHSWQPRIDSDQIRQVCPDVGLILACNTFGSPGDVDAWRASADTLGVPLLIDSASGLGSTYPDGRRLGGAGAIEVFSLHATKTIGVGEGGVIATPDIELANSLRRARNFGIDASGQCVADGLNAKLAEIHAAIACVVLDDINSELDRRRRVAQCYRIRLEPLGCTFQAAGEFSTYQCVPVLLPPHCQRVAVQDHLKRHGIETRAYFSPPLHAQPHFRARGRLDDLAVTERISSRILSLPAHAGVCAAEVEELAALLAVVLS